MSQGALTLLEVINKAPGQSGDDYRMLSELSRNQWNKLSAELRRNNLVYTERATVTKNGKETSVFKWYAGEKPSRTKKRQTKRIPPALRKPKPKIETNAKPAKTGHAGGHNFRVPKWTPDELSLLKEKFEEGLKDEEIAELLPLRNKSSVRQRRGILGLRHFSRRGRPTTKNAKGPAKTRVKASIEKAKSQPRTVVGLDTVQGALLKSVEDLVDVRIQKWLKEHGVTARINELEKKVAQLSTGQSSKDAEQDAKLDSVRSSLADLTNLLSNIDL